MEKEEFQGKAVEFEDMVQTLFKTDSMHNEHAGLMHAAIGISGEVAELLIALKNDDAVNIKEESGDLEFYIVAIRQCAEINESMLMHANEVVMHQNHALLDAHDGLNAVAGDILDLAKRCWVYGNSLEEKRKAITHKVALLMHYLDLIYDGRGYRIEEIRKGNMMKLIGPEGRFRDQVYTDEAATERADKQGEEV